LLHDILAERRPLSAAMCLRIARLFGSSPEMWMRLQATYELQKARQDKAIAKSLRQIVPLKQLDEALV
jgi:plasmid maintenance system antidote protein VapI